jgi:hypothetical protein
MWLIHKYMKRKEKVARPERFERPTPRFVVWCSIQLSYGRAGPFSEGAEPSRERRDTQAG